MASLSVIVTFVAPTSVQDIAPSPSVFNTWFGLPSSDGSVSVTSDKSPDGAANVILFVPFPLLSKKSILPLLVFPFLTAMLAFAVVSPSAVRVPAIPAFAPFNVIDVVPSLALMSFPFTLISPPVVRSPANVVVEVDGLEFPTIVR